MPYWAQPSSRGSEPQYVGGAGGFAFGNLLDVRLAYRGRKPFFVRAALMPYNHTIAGGDGSSLGQIRGVTKTLSAFVAAGLDRPFFDVGAGVGLVQRNVPGAEVSCTHYPPTPCTGNPAAFYTASLAPSIVLTGRVGTYGRHIFLANVTMGFWSGGIHFANFDATLHLRAYRTRLYVVVQGGTGFDVLNYSDVSVGARVRLLGSVASRALFARVGAGLAVTKQAGYYEGDTVSWSQPVTARGPLITFGLDFRL
ncbi:MAG: hypothetical protein U0230_20285 [Polyangiales bacterium]